jgi:PAS domain S-box-containing protein
MLDLMFQVNSKGIFEYVSPSIKELLGYEAEDIIGKRDYEFIGMVHPDDFEILIDTIQLVTKTLKPNRAQHRFKHADGHYIWVETVGNPLSDDKGEFSGAVYITRDITELKNVENQLKSSLEEKEVLLREIHHRVKNNMQIISSLLNLQSRHLNDEKTVNVLKESRNRVRSMAMVHEELYRSHDLSKIDFADYIQRLLSGLFNSYGVDYDFIKSEINVEDVLLTIDIAVPCGLIINELISNSLKHAFVHGQKGKISLKFHPDGEKYILTVADDGIGIPENIDLENTKTLGLQLVNTLVKQLYGSIDIYRDTGTLFKIVF